MVLVYYGVRMINGETKIFGVIGDPIEHSFSPAMHNAGFKELNMNYVYLPFNVKQKDLSKAIAGANGLNIKGLNVTIPHKTNVISELDELDPIAKVIGAVNTIKFNNDEGTAKGYNTDGIGAVKAINEVTSVKNKNVVITGAGGAARAVASTIANSGINSLVIINRNFKKAKILSNSINENLKKIGVDCKISSESLDKLAIELDNADILIDTTPLGMDPNINQKPIATADMMHENLLVNDIVYTPLETTLLKEAKIANAKTISGIKMLLYQGVESFKIWTGLEAPVEIMEKSLLNSLGLINK